MLISGTGHHRSRSARTFEKLTVDVLAGLALMLVEQGEKGTARRPSLPEVIEFLVGQVAQESSLS